MTKLNRFVSVVAAAGLAATALVMTSTAHADSTIVISSDLPLQGSAFDSNDSTNKAIQLYLDSIGNKVTNSAGTTFNIEFKTYDDATAAAGSWDPAKCTQNAQDHVANANEVAVMGTYNSGCAKIIVPILNQDPKGPMLMVSDANTNPGLTKTWDKGEPAKYYPTGKRNYARVATTDDNQGTAAAEFAKQKLGIKSVYVLNDTETYGQGVAQAFTSAAKKLGIKVLSPGAYGQGWDKKQSSYTALFTKIKALHPDMIYVGGIFDNNGPKLIKDKVKILGPNSKVKLMAPDGFTGYPDFTSMKESADAYLTFAGLSTDILLAKYPKGAAASFIKSYKAKYSADPVGSYPVYGVAAIQVILAAIAKSDGTRKGVRDAVFTGSGVSVPAATSVLGKVTTIDPKTGDVNAKDITIEIVTDNRETTLTSWAVK